MDEKQHPDSIWTWKTSARSKKACLWIPYLHKLERIKGGWCIQYNGGEVETKLKDVDCIMLYGASGELHLPFLDELSNKKISLLIHRRNLADPYVFTPNPKRDEPDVLTAQVLARNNQTKSAYVARSLIRERFKSFGFPVAPHTFKQLASCRSVAEVRNIEALQTRQYWIRYFEKLGETDLSRRAASPISAALDAGSFFLYGIILRWLLLHKFSPAHGFLHITSGYPSLAYDLMEPYRYIIEDAVLKAHEEGAEDLTAATFNNMKKSLDTTVYVPSHRCSVRRKNLLHGVVLALRAWLLGEDKRLVLPCEGERIGGRRPQTGYKLPGASLN